jgi:hypothetical protein
VPRTIGNTNTLRSKKGFLRGMSRLFLALATISLLTGVVGAYRSLRFNRVAETATAVVTGTGLDERLVVSVPYDPDEPQHVRLSEYQTRDHLGFLLVCLVATAAFLTMRRLSLGPPYHSGRGPRTS